MRDIAKIAGVGTMAVSRVLNGNIKVSPVVARNEALSLPETVICGDAHSFVPYGEGAMNNLTIHKATMQDIPAILTLYRDAQIDGDGGFTIQEATEHFAALSRHPYFHVFVALSDGTIAGTYELAIFDNMAKRGKKSGVIEDVAVDPGHQGKGIGRAMMEHALETCRLAGCYKMTLSSNLKREGAHRFYESLGFVRHGYSFHVELATP